MATKAQTFDRPASEEPKRPIPALGLFGRRTLTGSANGTVAQQDRVQAAA